MIALDTIANYKHALRFYNEYKEGGTNLSGMKIEDMAEHVLRKMYVFLCGKSKKKSEGDPTKFEEENMPVKYLFTGYFVFILFGPQPMSGKTLSCLTVNGKSNFLRQAVLQHVKKQQSFKKPNEKITRTNYVFERKEEALS